MMREAWRINSVPRFFILRKITLHFFLPTHHIKSPYNPIIEFALKKGYIEKNPLDLVNPIKVKHKKPQPLSQDEIKRFLQHVSPLYSDFFAFMFITGIRMGEAAALQWQDVKLAEGYFNVKKTYVRGNVYDPKRIRLKGRLS